MSRFIPLSEALDLPLLGNRDYLKRAKGHLLTWAKYVYPDLNITTLKIARRQIFKINKRTNTVDMPCEFSQLCSVNVKDHCGNFLPVFLNDRLHDDLVDIAADKDCACEYKCGYKMCNTIKGYESIVCIKSDYLPTGAAIDFKCVDRKAIDNQGFFYEEKQYPQRIYHSGVWVDTIKHTETIKLCKVEVDEHGCCCDTDVNVEAICNSCGITDNNYRPPLGGTADCPPNKHTDTWIYYCNSKLDLFWTQCGGFPIGFNRECNNIYNISELQDRLIFPWNFGHDSVMIRFYEDVDLNKLQIPLIAVDTFVMGLLWWDTRFSMNKNEQLLSIGFGKQYATMKFGLLKELNKYRIAEIGQILSPKAYIPSYVLGINNLWYPQGFGYFFNNGNTLP